MEPAPSRPLAVVTGASSGIGRELAARFAEGGFDLIVAAEDERIVEAARSLAAHGAEAGLQDSRLGEIKKDGPAEVARQGIAALLAGQGLRGRGLDEEQAPGRGRPHPAGDHKAAMQGRLTEPRGNDDSG
jgi:NAD(P)-dependent dehydrogenase (short-subunit alcohol dehydrogenase family)